MKTYLRILKFAKPNAWYVPPFLVITVLYSVFQVVNIVMLIPLLEVLFKTVDPEKVELLTEAPDFSLTISYFKKLFYFHFHEYLVQVGEYAALKYVCAVLIVTNVLSNIFRYSSGIILATIRARVIADIRQRIFDVITYLQLGYFTETRKGDIASRVTTDALLIEATVISSLKVLFKEPFLIVGYFVALFSINSDLTWYGLAILPLSGGIISFIAKKLKKKATASQESLGRMGNILDETLSGMRIIKAFTARFNVISKFQKEVQTYRRLNVAMSKRYELAGPTSEFLGVFAMSAILLIGGEMIISGDENAMAGPEFLTFLIIFSQILNPLKAFSNSFSNIQRGIAAGDRIFEITDTEPAIKDQPGAKSIDSLEESISIENVDFSYDKELVLQDINITVKKGQMIALVGPSGSGKSTIADLIPRFYDPTSGAVKIDGEDIKHFQLESLRGLMGIVTQESILFNDTVFNNIAFGKPDASLPEVIEAAKIANAHEFIENLTDGYETSIGERGTKLSGGQRQRLSIARAVLKNPPVLILDEATSALDSESEMLVQGAINNLMKNRTSIVIAHRLSTIQSADEIIVLKEGKIIQRGKHEDLLDKEGLYKKLIEMQSF